MCAKKGLQRGDLPELLLKISGFRLSRGIYSRSGDIGCPETLVPETSIIIYRLSNIQLSYLRMVELVDRLKLKKS